MESQKSKKTKVKQKGTKLIGGTSIGDNPTKSERSKFEKPLKSKQTRFEKKKSDKSMKPIKKDKGGATAVQSSGAKVENETKKAGVKRKTESTKSDGSDAKKIKLEEMTVKERRKQRKSAKAHYDIASKSKQLWDMLRREDCPKAKQVELSNEVYSLVKGKIDPLVYAHDTARVIECLMICGSETMRNNLYEETKGKLLPLMKSKYSKFFVMKLLKYGTKEHRDSVMKAMHGKVVKLAQHTDAAEVVEMAYNEYANVNQRQQLTVEFYGPAYALFKDKHASSLQQLLSKETHQKDNILAFMKETLVALVEKTVIRHSIIHHVLLEYLKHCSVKDREEMIETIREKVVEILHTKEGARIGMQCIWHGTSKDRKAMIKSMRGHATKVSMEENGYLVLLTIFDCVDDTKLVQKVLLEEMLKNGADLALHPTGRKVLLYLIAPRHGAHFHPDIIKILSEGDGNATSKKDSTIRRRELLTAVSDTMLQIVTDNAEKLIECPGACLFVKTVIKNCSGDLSGIFTKISELASKPLNVDEDPNSHIVESGAGHRLLKGLIKEDKERFQQEGTVLFSEILLKTVSEESLHSWIECNRGAFILLTLVESEIIPVIGQIAVKLNPVMHLLKKKKFKGAELLHTKLKSLE